MRRLLVALVGVALVVSLAGCSPSRMSVEEVEELAAARDVCNENGGVFSQWVSEFGVGYRCDFDQRESDQ
ncbi:hypothetical protein [Microcella sp.]|uniref:hypothetical protein n=1 Tax=Microcella sp. TaxID=1913979 RepID=UPI00391B842D